MIALTRVPLLFVAAAGAGALVWASTQLDLAGTGGYWADHGLLAAGGLVLALAGLSRGLGGWHGARFSPLAFVLAFLPALVAGGWLLAAGQPPNWAQSHVLEWSRDLRISGLVADFRPVLEVISFGLGLVLGLTLDTPGARGVEARTRRPELEPLDEEEPRRRRRIPLPSH
jgi:hypothetical protein